MIVHTCTCASYSLLLQSKVPLNAVKPVQNTGKCDRIKTLMLLEDILTLTLTGSETKYVL